MDPRLRKTLLTGLITVVAVGLAYLSCGGTLFWVAPAWQIAIFCGAVGGLAAGSILQAGLAAPLAVLFLAFIDAPWYVDLFARPMNAQEALLLGGVTAAAAVGVSALRFKAGLPAAKVNWALSLGLLAMVLVNLWVTPYTVDFLSAAQNGSELAADLQRVPEKLSYSSDAEAYLRIHHLMKQGMPYYDAVRDAWEGKVGAESLPWGVVSYRLPTLFWLWNLLPAGGTALIPAFLVFATLAVIAAFAVPAQVGLVRLAPVAAVLLAGNYIATAVTLFITYVDPWAMALTLAGFAVLVGSEVRPSRALVWVSVGLLIAAALMREILVYVPLVIAASALLLPRGERLKGALPWLVGLAVFAAGYVAHVVAIGDKVAPTAESQVWSRGSVAALKAAVDLAQGLMLGKPWFMWIAMMLGIAGAAGLWMAVNRRLSVIALVCTVAPMLGLTVVGNPGITQGELMVNYWGMLFIPLNLALVPLSVLLLRGRKPAVVTAAKPASGKKAKKR